MHKNFSILGFWNFPNMLYSIFYSHQLFSKTILYVGALFSNLLLSRWAISASVRTRLEDRYVVSLVKELIISLIHLLLSNLLLSRWAISALIHLITDSLHVFFFFFFLDSLHLYHCITSFILYLNQAHVSNILFVFSFFIGTCIKLCFKKKKKKSYPTKCQRHKYYVIRYVISKLSLFLMNVYRI